ncbi:MAG TPA: carboxypeptidase regulatory-like domain-containing protein [Candidatus Acidoferrum sp.]|nr:carboxypeptidase regulatory-like domain-containing protein [Candidatus Acidoferrum sp.]
MQLLGGLFVVLLLCLPAFSQGSFGRILGTVTDQSGGVVTGATVSVIDTERGVTRSLTTDDAGAYNAPNLTAGNYTVRVEAKGFKRVERQSVQLEVGHELRVDLIVQPGEQNQTVTVTESVPLVETSNATLGGTLENADIIDLPLNGRDYQNLLGLRPGVMLQPGGGPWTQSTNGVRPDESVWLVEGVINENFFDGRPVANMPGPFTDGATIMPIDAIQEFNVMESPKAEYGWKAGAVVNVGIKSGTNQIHGTAYAFGRTQSWDARNYFNVAPTAGTCIPNGSTSATPSLFAACDQLPAQLKQFGGVVGGPIKKDKLFFFGGYEGLRSFIGSAYGLTVPAVDSQGGPTGPKNSMPDAITALQLAGIPRSLISEELAGCTGDTPSNVSKVAIPVTCTGNLFPNTGATNAFLSPFPITNTSDNGVGKIDYHVNDKNTINGMFFLGNYNALGEDHGFANVAFNDNTPIRVWSDTASWVYTPNSNVVNELRIGYDRIDFAFVNADVNTFANGAAPYFLNTGVTNPQSGGLPNINIPGFGAGGQQILGTSTNRPQYFSPNPYYDFQDSVSILKGKHTFKFGGDFTHIEADSAIYVDGRGLFQFAGGGTAGVTDCGGSSCPLEDYFAGQPHLGQLLTGNAQIKLTWMNTAGFIQDDWHISPKVTVNMGLRYEYASPMNDANGHLGNFDPVLGMVQQGRGIGSIWNGDHRDFEPRLGLAWDVSGKGTTVLRAGFGMIHETYTLATFLGQFQLQNDNATSSAGVPTAANLFCSPGIMAGIQSACPANAGGTIGLQAVTFAPNQLCWDPGQAATCAAAGQATTFPVASARCGDGILNASQPSGHNPSPCDIMAVNPSLRNPYTLNFSLGITHTFGNNLSVEVGYVGNLGHRLLSFTDINQAPLGSSYCLNTLTAAQLADACGPNALTDGALATQEARPFYNKFPYIGFINEISNLSHSNYNSLQVSVTKRMSHGLSFNAGYTYAHGLDTGSLNRFGQTPQNNNDIAAEYASSDFDVRHRFTLTATYDIPGVKGFGQLLEGWEINAIVNAQSAQPWASWDAADNFSGTAENNDRWNITGPASNIVSGKNSIPWCTGFGATLAGDTPATVSCTITSVYGGTTTPATAAQISGCTGAAGASGIGVGAVNTLATGGCFASANGATFLTPPALGTFGNMGRNIFRDSGLKNLDFSVFKNFKFKERYGAQFRAEVFNILNHATAANPYGASSAVEGGNELQGGGPLGFAGVTPDGAAGNPLIGSGDNRAIQLGLKLTF